MQSQRQKLVEHLRAAKAVLVFTGAGISTGSGIPDFRGPNGVWKRRQPVHYQDFMRSEAARVEHWDYKLEGWAAFRQARPKATHQAIAQLERAGKLLAVVTQNIEACILKRERRHSAWWNCTAPTASSSAKPVASCLTRNRTSIIFAEPAARRFANVGAF